MSQSKSDVRVMQGRDDLGPLPNTAFPEFLVTLGTVASQGPAGLFGERVHGVMPQALPATRGPNTNVPTNPVEKFLKGLQRLLKKWGVGGSGQKSGPARALSTGTAPYTNVPTNPVEK